MKKNMSWLAMGMLWVVCLGFAGCGGDSGEARQSITTNVTATATAEGGMATETSTHTSTTKNTVTVVDAKTLKFDFVLEHGNVKGFKVDGEEVKPADVDYVVCTSNRMGNVTTSLYREAWTKNMKVVLTDLPNNESHGYVYLVMKSGKKALAELADFDFIKDAGAHSFINPSDSSIAWGELDDPSSKDSMTMEVNETTMKATIRINFGCDVLIGLKKSIRYQEGMTVVFEEADETIHSGLITANQLGNLSAEVHGIPVVEGPYDNGRVANGGKMYVVTLSGEKVPFNFGYNTPNTDGLYIWHFDTNQYFLYVNTYHGQYMHINWKQ